MDLDNFRKNLRIFTTTTEPAEHEESIISMLDPLDLDIEYKKLAATGDIERVLDIFSSFADTDEDEVLGDYEIKRMQQVGELSVEYFSKHNYSAFALMVFQLTLESISESYDLGEDVTKIDMKQLYENIPEEIYLQLFLLETMSDKKSFEWQRDPAIVAQSLFVLTVCFSDIYTFLLESDMDVESDG